MVVTNGNLEERVGGLFISSPYPGRQKFGGQPTGLLYALSVLANRKEAEHGSKDTVRQELEVWCPNGVTDFESSKLKKELTDYLIEKIPRIIGVSTFSVSYQNAVSIKNQVKQISPETIVVFGGAHEDNFVKHYKEKGSVDADFVIAGDGMFLLDELYKIAEQNPNATVAEVKNQVTFHKTRFRKAKGTGVLLYESSGELQEIHSQSLIPIQERRPISLDELPLMPRYLIRNEDETAIEPWKSIFNGKKTAQAMIGQGCPFGCGFCSEGTKKVFYDDLSPRSREPARNLAHVEKELQELKAKGYQAIFFDDSTFFAKEKQYMGDLAELLKKCGFELGCQTTQNTVHSMASSGLLQKLAKAGLTYVYMGIEHFDGQIRDSFGKSTGGGNKFNGYSIDDTIKLLENNEIRAGISLTFGHPDKDTIDESTRETQTTAKYVIDRSSELVAKFSNIAVVSLNLVTYHPGTPNSVRFEEEKKLGSIDYIGHPNNREPFIHFEEGMGPHAKGMTDELASFILHYAKQKLGNKLWL